ncbi:MULTISPECIES: cyclic-phosphate processing receiver domain-containing protein [Paenibacillus]|uniref:Cell division protein FtsJ n=1 Tax=Paenibacillus odorifer TaxID=189426 RepID=A0A1R0ZLW6_9BACL|nr:cyclic-phosphate processing receiver domain-containing protein [Paenibacillus odorifer]OME73167.1 cell division protein FtsJ [Paenibacillus odorifer]
MIHIYMDDLRKVPKGFALARSTEECLLMLRECEVDILSLDYDMGPGDYSGGEVARRIVLEGLFPREIYLHTSSLWGRKEMYEILYTAKPEGMLLVNGPLSSDKLRDIAEETNLK